MLFILASALLASAPLLTTTSDGCAAMRHTPAADVEYKEGGDAKGYAVAPADLTPPVLGKEDFRKVNIPLNLPLKNYPSDKPDFAKTDAERQKTQEKDPAQPPTYNADTSESWVQPGLVTVDTQTGKTSFDGKDLTPPDAAELNPDCWK